ncbi:MAG: pyridoxamine 5'-phosphate oxidase family protein [Caulobacter sp.]|nr:pyridoxamine 5'-phosphate oxidase family protein [Caulobacter sp.]
MSNEAELKSKFWKALKSDRTVMLGLVGEDDGGQPMTAQLESDEGGPVWFFTAADNDLVEATGSRRRALIHFASKGHDLFATVDGDLSVSSDRATIDRLWNPFVAAWFTGKDDPKIRLLRFDPREGQVWLNENSLFAGLKMLLGADPKQDYADKTGEVRLN